MEFNPIPRKRLYDFKPGDWVGVRYEPPKSPEPGCQERKKFEFPTIINRIEEGIDESKDVLHVEYAPQACPTALGKQNISWLVHVKANTE